MFFWEKCSPFLFCRLKSVLFMLFQFNTYSALLLPCFIQGILFFILLMLRGFRRERLSDKLVALLLLIYTLRITQWMLGFAGWYDVKDWHTSVMFYTLWNHWLAVGPLLYFYFRSLTNADFKFTKKDWLHFIPIGIWYLRALTIFGVDIAWRHWLQGEPLPHFEGTHGEMLQNGWGPIDNIWNYAEFLSIFIYLFLTFRLYVSYRKYVVENFSSTESIGFKWLRNLLIATALGHIIWIGFELVSLFGKEGLSYVEDWYSFFFIGLLIYYLSIEGLLAGTGERLRNALRFEPEKLPVEEEIELKNTEPDWGKNEKELLNSMEQERPYLNPDLTLQDLASKLKLTTATLSRLINSTQGKNFNDFVNEYRVKAVKKHLLDPDKKHFSLLAIALECGFNSKATFNRAFRKHAGMSPSQFIAENE